MNHIITGIRNPNPEPEKVCLNPGYGRTLITIVGKSRICEAHLCEAHLWAPANQTIVAECDSGSSDSDNVERAI